MADHFGAIAAGNIGCKRVPLHFPAPIECGKDVFTLEPTTASAMNVYKKINTREQLDEIIEDLRIQYTPFMQKLAPKTESKRNILPLTTFDMRYAEKEDFCDFSRVLRGEGNWQKVTIPHYFGPTGENTAYYRTTFEASNITSNKAAFICFDGADYIAEVFINGSFAGNHEGFFAPFEFDISKYLREGENVLTVVLKNDFVYGGNQGPTAEPVRLEGDKLYAATGPGYDDAETGWHHCPPGFGIYQGVRFEVRERAFISDIFVRPLVESGECEIFCEVYNCDYAPLENVKLSFSVYGENFEDVVFENTEYQPITFAGADFGGSVNIAELDDAEKMGEARALKFFKGANLVRLTLPMKNARLWDTHTPWLYKAVAKLYCAQKLCDTAESSFGMRSFTQDTKSSPKGMFYLNGKPLRLRGANTMGYEQQDVMRGDTDALLYDMLMAKACNMNFLRLTQRPVQKEIYELCDTIGLMLQTDLPLFTVVRRTKFAECVRQAEEMERLIRPHASAILVSYINEPMANADNRPHRHLVRSEMEGFFAACDSAVRILNPDRVIKHIDGDYDPPDSTMPDNHCYCTWYNGHGIDIGKLHRGYWLGVKEGWYYACGEFGAEGLDPAPLMLARYPKHWLPEAGNESAWEPGMIKDAQSGNMHFFYYDAQKTLEDWSNESRKYQALATRMQTRAFRRDPRMASIAIHLFIDAWPSGWMKTIVDCERNPKQAFYEYRDALTPLMVDIRTDRWTYFSGESAAMDVFVCNDTLFESDGNKIVVELADKNGKLIKRCESEVHFTGSTSVCLGKARFECPEVASRQSYTVRAILLGKNGDALHYSEESIDIFPTSATPVYTAVTVSGEEFLANAKKYVGLAESGKTVVINTLPVGSHVIAGTEVKVKACGMRPLHFVSRDTAHELVSGFKPYDFRYWYSEKDDMITPIISSTFIASGAVPILTSGNSLKGSAWGQKLHPALACAELSVGDGKIIINQVDLASHITTPVAKLFADRLYTY